MDEEGVIKFELAHEMGHLPSDLSFSELQRWRRALWQRGLIGQDGNRYEGAGYGNVSARAAPNGEAFLISGTQTGHVAELKAEGYALVRSCDLSSNNVTSIGEVKPSSESLTHAAFYQARPGINFVFHVHSPKIWQHAEALDLPATGASVPYGTPEMAQEIERVLVEMFSTAKSGVISMGGHEDGVIAFGPRAAIPGDALWELSEHVLLL